MRILKKVLIYLVSAFVLFSVVGFFVAPPLLKSLMEKKLSETLHRKVTVQKVSINPYRFSARIQGFMIRERESTEPFLSFEELSLGLDIHVLKGLIVLRDITLKRPFVGIVLNKDGSYNFSDLIKSEKKVGEGKVTDVKFVLNGIRIVDGGIDFDDQPKGLKHTVREMNLTLPFFSNRPKDLERFLEPSLTMKVNDDPYTIGGKARLLPDSMEVFFDFDIKGIDIPYYMAYAPFKPAFTVLSGAVNVNAKLSFTQFPDKPTSLTLSGNLALANLVVQDGERRKAISLPSMEAALTSFDPFGGSLHLSKVLVKGPEFIVKRDGEGTINLLAMMPVGEPQKPASPAPAKPSAAPTEKTSPFLFLIDEVVVESGKVTFDDLVPDEPVRVTVEKLELKGQGITTEKGKKTLLAMKCDLNKRGSIGVEGSFGLDPLEVDAKVTVKRLEILPLQAYFTDKIRTDITGGEVSVDGTVSLRPAVKGGLTAQFTGASSVVGFSSVDRQNAEDFLSWQSLALKSIDVRYNPTAVTIKGVSLTDFYSRLTINSDRSLNVTEAFTAEEEPAAKVPIEAEKEKKPAGGAPAPGAPSPPKPVVTVDTITLQGGKIDFEDRSIKPQVAARLEEIAGRVSGLSSKAGTTADVDVRARVQGYAPIEITGKINPLSDNLFVDLKARVSDMDLTTASPYSGKYAGYGIEKGKLSLNVEYLVQNRKLESKNNIVIDQFTFGERVESPDATGLPVKLAIALLKDRNGQIKLDLPVAGSLDDPKFSIWGIVWQVIKNLLVKAATSPFALLGSLFGKGEELGYVEFEYGSTALTGANVQKVETLTKALVDRPSLSLDIEGHVDQEKDTEGLKQYLSLRKVKTQKMRDLVKKGETVKSVDDVKVEEKEYEQYLRAAYKAEKFPKPKNVVGLEKTIPVPEMEKLMLTHIEVKPQDMRTLAIQRAASIREVILKGGQVPAGRVFVTEPKSLAPEKKEKVRDSRVDFKLR
jgi:hypothetical protein